MTEEEQDIIEQSKKADQNKADIITAKFNVAANYLVLAKLLKENRDKSYWKLNNCDSFEEFLGQPEIGFSRTKAYLLIHIWELYKDKLQIDDHTLLDIGNAKLALIAPVVESDKESWLARARHLSKSDLLIELGRGPGETQLSPPPSAPAHPPDCQVCVGCGKTPVDKHHFPVTRGAGAPEGWWIPLCRECHTDYHDRPKDWTWDNKRRWASYFYERISRD
jgi:hypothetical protein